MKRRLIVFLTLCALLGTALTVSAQAVYPLTLTDMCGREAVIEAPVTRAVALTAAECEILYAVGAGDLLVGRGEYCDYPAEAASVPAVRSGAETNLEQIIALAPQVVVTSKMDQDIEQIQALEAAGIRVIETDADDIAGVYEAIGLIGRLTDRTENAEAVVRQMRETFEEVSAQADGAGESVYFEVSPLEYGLWTAGQGTFMNEIAELIGLRNCFSDVNGWAGISEEAVIERNPDRIVTIAMYFGEGPTPEEEILSRAGWQDIAAVKNRAILNLQGNELSRPGPRLADGARMLRNFVRAR